jgi:sporulation protein YlmC with PRC-barrel domain
MPHYGLLRDYQFDDVGSTEDIRGSNVYGRNDEKLGKIDDVIFDHSTGVVKYVVVDTGGWFYSRKFLVPPHRLHLSAEHDNDFAINLNKEQIESLPRYKESDVESGEKWQDYDKRYAAAWHFGPLQHREASDHDVTPTPDEMPPEPGSIGEQLTPSERAEASWRIIPATSKEVTIQSNAAGIGSRWLTFEERLRQRRHDLTRACTTCAVELGSDKSSESAGQERKAS